VIYNLGTSLLPRERFVAGKDHIFFFGVIPHWALSWLRKLTSSKIIFMPNQKKVSGISFGEHDCGLKYPLSSGSWYIITFSPGIISKNEGSLDP
jgi:hypothetical protein